MSSTEHEAMRSVGFNTRVVHEERTFDVQTEVLGHDALMVRTTVLEGGVVRLSSSQPCEVDAKDVKGTHELIAAYHDRVVRRVKRGEIG